MDYSLKRKNSYKVLYAYEEKGFVVTPLNSSDKYKVSVSKITLVDKDLINYYITKRVNKKFEKLFKKMYDVLTDEDDTDEDTPLILDEIAKLKSIVITKYKEYISEKTYKDILKKLLIAEEEFKNNYNQKLLLRSYNNFDYGFEESKGKSR